MLRMDQVHVLRHRVLNEGQSIRRVARELGISRNTVSKDLEQSEPLRRPGRPRGRPVPPRGGPRAPRRGAAREGRRPGPPPPRRGSRRAGGSGTRGRAPPPGGGERRRPRTAPPAAGAVPAPGHVRAGRRSLGAFVRVRRRRGSCALALGRWDADLPRSRCRLSRGQAGYALCSSEARLFLVKRSPCWLA